MPLPPEFRVTEADGTLRVEWDNCEVAKNGAGPFVFVGSFFGLISLAFTFGLIADLALLGWQEFDAKRIAFLSCFLPFGWAFTLFIAYRLLQRTWRECLDVGRDTITHSITGRLAPKPTAFPLATVVQVAVAWYVTDEARTDSMDHARVIIRSNRRYEGEGYILSEWLTDPLQEQLFLTIRDFATRTGLPLTFAEWGKRPDWAQKS